MGPLLGDEARVRLFSGDERWVRCTGGAVEAVCCDGVVGSVASWMAVMRGDHEGRDMGEFLGVHKTQGRLGKHVCNKVAFGKPLSNRAVHCPISEKQILRDFQTRALQYNAFGPHREGK